MVDKIVPRYMYQKDGTYYFSRHVPNDVRHHYACDRIVICLKTSSKYAAINASRSIAGKLDDYWMKLRLSEMTVPAAHLLVNGRSSESFLSKHPKLSEAMERYMRLKGVGRSKTFFAAATRNIGYVTKQFGDRPIDAYSSADAANLRDHLVTRGLRISSVSRIFATIRAVINLTIGEEGLDCRNSFANTYFPNEVIEKTRHPIPVKIIRKIQKECLEIGDSNRLLIALISDTGMRLSEAVGLIRDDVILDHKYPHINLKPHPWRSLKTAGSKRQIPLVGAALEAMKVMHRHSQHPYLFKNYTDKNRCNGNSASAALNKWLKPRVPQGCVVHSFRHSMRDRLRAADVNSEIIDDICGWSSQSVGQSYGDGYSLEQKYFAINSLQRDFVCLQ